MDNNNLHTLNTEDLLRVFCRIAIAKPDDVSAIVMGFFPDVKKEDFYGAIKDLAKSAPMSYGADAAEFFFSLGYNGICAQLCTEQFNYGINEVTLLPLIEKLLKKNENLEFDAHRLVRIRKYDDELKNRVLAFKCLDLMGYKADPADEFEPDLPFDKQPESETLPVTVPDVTDQPVYDITGEPVKLGCFVTFDTTTKARARDIVVRLNGILSVMYPVEELATDIYAEIHCKTGTPITKLQNVLVVTSSESGRMRNVCAKPGAPYSICPAYARVSAQFPLSDKDDMCSLGCKKIGCKYMRFSSSEETVPPAEVVEGLGGAGTGVSGKKRKAVSHE